EQEDRSSLRHAFNNQNARHQRSAGEMPHKERLVDGHILERHHSLHALQLQNPVNQEKRITMPKQRLNLVDVQRAAAWGRLRSVHDFTHSKARIIEDLRIKTHSSPTVKL